MAPRPTLEQRALVWPLAGLVADLSGAMRLLATALEAQRAVRGGSDGAREPRTLALADGRAGRLERDPGL